MIFFDLAFIALKKIYFTVILYKSFWDYNLSIYGEYYIFQVIDIDPANDTSQAVSLFHRSAFYTYQRLPWGAIANPGLTRGQCGTLQGGMEAGIVDRKNALLCFW